MFLGERSFATWHEALDHYEILPYTRILPRHGAAGGKELFCPDAGVHDGREERVLANDTAEGFVQRMRAAYPSFDGDLLLHHQLRFLFPKS